MTIAIHKVKAIEIEALRKLEIDTFTESFGSMNKADDMDFYVKNSFSLKQVTKEFQNPNSKFYFLKDVDTIIGYLKINIGDAQTENKLPNALEIERIYLRSKYQRKGLGKQLLEKAVSIAQEENIKTIWLGVWEDNLKAIGFYKKQNFVVFDSHKFMLGKDEQSDVLMKLELV